MDEEQGVLIQRDHLQALSGLLGMLMVTIRHYQPSDELYEVLRSYAGSEGWGRLLAEGNPQGVWLVLQEITRLEGWLRSAGLGHPRLREIPPLPEIVAASYAERRGPWREG